MRYVRDITRADEIAAMERKVNFKNVLRQLGQNHVDEKTAHLDQQ